LPSLQLASAVRHHLYLAIKEALHNIVKHADASEVWLRLRFASDTMSVIIEDNGRGFEPTTPAVPDADGLANFRQRMHAIGGRCEQQSRPGQGTIVTFTVPLKNRIPEAG
jgi:signal transduction histidine kinase